MAYLLCFELYCNILNTLSTYGRAHRKEKDILDSCNHLMQCKADNSDEIKLWNHYFHFVFNSVS